MDVKQIRYILEIAEEGSISKAAEKLFMTQSALNQQLLRLERELGLALFSRISHSMVPTYAGTVYLEAAQKILDIREETYKFLHDISNLKRGEISVAYTPERGSIMFSHVYPEFHRVYPEITFKIHEARVVRMEQLLEKKQVDMAFIAQDNPHPHFEYHKMGTELMVLGVPATHPLATMAGEKSWIRFPSIDMSLFKEEYFVLMNYETRMRRMIDAVFERAGIRPKILFESTSTTTIVNMVRNQVCCAFFPQSYVDPQAPIAYFSTTPPVTWTLAVATRKGVYLNKAEKDFIKMAQDYHSRTMGIY